MGAWGTGNFENDDALDWIGELQSSKDLAPIFAAFSEVTEGSYLEAPDCANALAAAEVVAAYKGNPSKDLPNEIANWVSSNRLSVDNELIVTAKNVVNKIRQSSELRELWEESGSLDEWEDVIGDLDLRLEAGHHGITTNDNSAASPESFNDWFRKKWYIFVITAGIGVALAQLFISGFPILIGILAAYAVCYVIYKMQNPE
jgi:hypothetical protein